MHVEFTVVTNRAGSGDRPRMCPAWGQTCKAHGKQNHFEKVCRSKGDEKRGAIRYIEDEEAATDVLIAHMVFDPLTDTYKPDDNNGREEIDATVISFTRCSDPRRTRYINTAYSNRLRIYPDSDTTIFLGRLKHLGQIGLSE